MRCAHCLHDLAPTSARELLSQAVDQRLHRAETEVHPVRYLLITDVRFHSTEKRRQRFEEIRLAFCGTFCAEFAERALKHDARPAGIVHFIRCSFMIGTQMMELLGLQLVR